jgi:hypothetical protein
MGPRSGAVWETAERIGVGPERPGRYNLDLCIDGVVVRIQVEDNRRGKIDMLRPLVLCGALFCVAGITGCVAVNATQLGMARQRPAVPAAEVVLYRTADQVPGKYEEVALLNAEGSTSFTSEKGMYAKMQQQAGKLGANGVIMDALSEPSSGAKVAAAIFGVDVNRKGRAIAIYLLPNASVPKDSTTAK